MNSLSISTPAFEMSTSNNSKRNLFQFSFWTAKKKKEKKKILWQKSGRRFV